MRRTGPAYTKDGIARRTSALLALLVLLCPAEQRSQVAIAQSPAPTRAMLAVSPRVWLDAAAANQDRIINDDNGVALRYRVRNVDAKGDTTREVIESREGTVARLVQRNGAPITAAEDSAERDRLNDILQSPDAFLRHHRRDRAARDYATQLVHLMPQAMVWSYAPGQPQPPNAHGTQIVLDFRPDPNFKPPTMLSEGLTGIAGRVWIDVQSRCVTRIEGRFLHPVDFGWGGVVARIGEGGTMELEQTQAADRRWIYSHLTEHITVREILFHTVVEDTQMNAWDPHVLPASLPFRDAVRALLALPVQTQ